MGTHRLNDGYNNKYRYFNVTNAQKHRKEPFTTNAPSTIVTGIKLITSMQ
jgi:hypothetical protein